MEGNIQSGDTLLVNDGASGLASVMLPMAKAFGIRVITTVRKAEQVRRSVLSVRTSSSIPAIALMIDLFPKWNIRDADKIM